MVVLGSSKVPLEFGGAHPEPRSDTCFADNSIDNQDLKFGYLGSSPDPGCEFPASPNPKNTGE